MRKLGYLFLMSAVMLLSGWLFLSCEMHRGVWDSSSNGGAVALRTPTTTAEASPASRVSAEARRILANVRSTRYQYATQIDEAQGSYALDCSGLACVILKKVSPGQLSQVAVESSRSRQRAWEFYETFAAASRDGIAGWRTVPRMLDARPGDLLARRKKEIKPGEVTGHVMVIDEAPVLEKPGLVRVVVIDSTSQPHASDTRAPGTNGVGRGTIWIEIDGEGKPVAWRTSPDAKGTVAPFAIGRVVEIP
jgi:hypothetical protein